MPWFAVLGMGVLHPFPLFQPCQKVEKERKTKTVRPGAKLQSQLCCPHRDLGITSGLPYFKHPAVEEHINQK